MSRASPNAPPRPMTTPTSASTIPWRTTMFFDLRRLRAERQADADLLRPLLDRVGHQAVDADRGEQQRAAAEDRHHPHVELLPRHRQRDDLVHRLDVGDRQARSTGAAAPGSRCSATAAAPACARSTRSASGSTFSALAASGTCACGMNICGCGSLSSPLLLMSADDADDLALRLRPRTRASRPCRSRADRSADPPSASTASPSPR